MCAIESAPESIAETRERLIALIETETEWMRVTVTGPRHHAYRNIRRWRLALCCLNALESESEGDAEPSSRAIAIAKSA